MCWQATKMWPSQDHHGQSPSQPWGITDLHSRHRSVSSQDVFLADGSRMTWEEWEVLKLAQWCQLGKQWGSHPPMWQIVSTWYVTARREVKALPQSPGAADCVPDKAMAGEKNVVFWNILTASCGPSIKSGVPQYKDKLWFQVTLWEQRRKKIWLC